MTPEAATPDNPLLDSWGIEDFARGSRNLQGMRAYLGTTLDQLVPFLNVLLPDSPDSDLALNALERFFANRASRELVPILLAEDGRQLGVFIQLAGTSQFLGDVLASDPDFLETATAPLRVTPTLDELVEQLRQDIGNATDDNGVLRAIRRFRRRQMLRIGVNDIVRDRPLEEITGDLSRLAEASIVVAWELALQSATARLGEPRTFEGLASRSTVLAFGKLGGSELNYSSDIDLMVVYDEEGQTAGRRPVALDEYFSRAVSELIRLLSAHTDRGQAYRVDFRLRPEGQRGALARSLASTLSYYDTLGRTWERQALIKVRPVAGDSGLGQEFFAAVEPFVYKRFLSFAEINEIKAMKRKIEQQAHRGAGPREVKTGPGGIRDVEFIIQFLQLLNGGDLKSVRHRDTLGAMQSLESAGCLTDTEYRGLDDAYRFLRKVEHRLQLLFDLQTHRLPEKTDELRKLALRMGYGGNAENRVLSTEYSVLSTELASSTLSPQKHSPLDEPSRIPSLDTRDLLLDPLDRFLHDFNDKTRLNRTILNHLLHLAFADSSDSSEPESDLILEPEPDAATIAEVLCKYGFRDIPAAWRNLTRLTQEQRFLSTRRCRHFLANIAPQLLRAVAATTDPDQALNNLEQVTASLGGKAVLWELFSFNPPSLKLYVDVCDSPFLSQMLINNPGMIDDLLDSLILNRPRDLADLRGELTELLRGAHATEAVESILHSFQDKEILRIAVRDLLGKDDVRSVTAELSDVAETLLVEAATRQQAEMREKFGDAGPHVVLALGKLGGREMSYHSDLDLVIVYAREGTTNGPKPLDHFEYFTEYARRVIKSLSHHGPLGRLYAVDMRLRPTGQSGSLVIPLDEFCRYFSAGAQIWERQSLTRARPIHGDETFTSEVMAAVRRAMLGAAWGQDVAAEIRSMRQRLEASAPARSLKRGIGGMTDVEFVTQAFQLHHGREMPDVCRTNTWECLDALRKAGLLSDGDHNNLSSGYSFHRLAEARLRIVTNRPLNEYPDDPQELEKLARRMGFTSGAEFQSTLSQHASDIRQTFERLTH